MAFKYWIRDWAVGTALYLPSPATYGIEVIVRGGGGGGASGRDDSRSEDVQPGPGGGGGGCSVSPRMILRDEIPEEGVPMQVGGGGARGLHTTNSWSQGGGGGDSWFGDFLFAGGGGGGGVKPLEDGLFVRDFTFGGRGGYGLSRGGRGLTYLDTRHNNGSWLRPRYGRTSEADTINEVHMAAGGGGGGHGYGWWGYWDEDEDGNDVWNQVDYPWRFGGSSGAAENTTVQGATGSGTLPHWKTLQTGCGGNGRSTIQGTGGSGGFPSGGGAGGSGAGNGGNGGSGRITVIELLRVRG